MRSLSACKLDKGPQVASRWCGFTLIELLVVVAIIALLISILLPSLGQARAQARTSLCLTRISQITKAMLLYADDFGETFPFMGLGWEDVENPGDPSKNLSSTSGGPGDIPTKSEWEWATSETWLTQHPELLWNGTLPESEWLANGVGPRTGLLFNYARFETAYRCPDFERITDAKKSQNSFNYTRSILGRKWILSAYTSPDRKAEPDWWGGSAFGAPGPIMKSSQIFAPSNAIMMNDEWWKRHVAVEYQEHSPPRDTAITGGWMANDCMHYPLGDELGQYHGTPTYSKYLPRVDPTWKRDTDAAKQGDVSFFDGHAGQQRQWWVNISGQSTGALYGSLQEAVLPYLSEHIYAVRGKYIVYW